MDKLKLFSGRGYYVKENVVIYYTPDMDKTLTWFEATLGWYGKVIDRDENGMGSYGFVADMPQEMVMTGAVPFKGIHLWPGEPVQKTLTLIQVKGVEVLHRTVKQSGWEQISEVHQTGASPQTCHVTTVDGCVLTFFE